jgi:hypothetical protein
MQIIDPRHYNTKADELARFSSTFNQHCKREFIGWNCRGAYVLKSQSPSRYFEVYKALGKFVRTTKGSDPYEPKRIL